MQRFWSRLAVELGKRAGVVVVVGVLLTVVLGYGITKLDFATGQDSYLNKDEQVYKDNVVYQRLFGGEGRDADGELDQRGHGAEPTLPMTNASGG